MNLAFVNYLLILSIAIYVIFLRRDVANIIEDIKDDIEYITKEIRKLKDNK